MRLTLKWKVFYVLNVIFLVFSALMIFYVLDEFYTGKNAPAFNAHDSESEGLLYVNTMIASALFIFLNGCLNIFLLHRYFPDRSLSKTSKLLNKISLFCSLLAWIGLLALFVYASIESAGYGWTADSLSAVSVVAGMIVGLGYILILQLGMTGVLAARDRKKMGSLIDSLGNPAS